MRKVTGVGFEEVYVEVSHDIDGFILSIVEIGLKLLGGIVLSVENSTDNVRSFWKLDFNP